MKLSPEQTNRLVSVVSEHYDEASMWAYGSPQKLYDALARSAQAQDPPYLTREPDVLYEIARRNGWPCVTTEVVAMLEP